MGLIIRLYKRIVGRKTNSIDNRLSRVQESVSAYNSTIDIVISQNTKLLGGE
ncbi:hypothetical protein TAFFO16_2 [Bacillus phage Taffo16]|uniref:Uncharacterized protein n=1 Tax=Bacillus phage Taffo16 TaxID=2030094 RepID=A0A249XUS5_9CAUD|nr:hypothetical protein TAFFO16_2 [Bacillus phage Taffo16]ULF48623.1 hypothetical protein [Bacillus phage BillyBob]ULF48912.1 hypothetical protein [Bacillus phage BillyBob]